MYSRRRFSLPLHELALGLVYTAVLYASFVHDLFRIAGPMHGLVIGFDSHHVLDRIDSGAHGAASWHPLSPSYLSQFGLQGIVLAGAARATSADPVTLSFAAASAWALLLCAGLASFFVAAGRWLGRLTGHLGVALAACSLIWMSFAPSLYWASILLLAPFLLVWHFEPFCAGRTGQMSVLAVVVGLGVALKCLCGYEYVTAVILSPLAALAFHRARLGNFSWRTLKPAFALGAAGLTGFGLALTLHSVQIAALTGESGWATIASRARDRTIDIGDPAQENHVDLQPVGPLRWLAPRTAYVVHAFCRYFAMPPIAAPTGLKGRAFIPLYWFVALVALMALAAWRHRLGRQGCALAVAGVVGLLASLSWQVLAVNHMAVHFHLNLVVFYLPFLPIAFLCVGWLVARAMHFIVGERAASLAIGCVAILLALGSAVRGSLQVVTEQTAEQRAIHAVIERVVAGTSLDAIALDGEIVHCRLVQRPAADWGFEFQRSKLGRNHSAWVESCDIAASCPGATPSRAVAIGPETPARSFAVVRGPNPGDIQFSVPSDMLRGDESIRIVLVSGKHDAQLREIRLPRDWQTTAAR